MVKVNREPRTPKRLSIELDPDLDHAVTKLSQKTGETKAAFAGRMAGTGVALDRFRAQMQEGSQVVARDPKTGKETLIATKDTIIGYRSAKRN